MGRRSQIQRFSLSVPVGNVSIQLVSPTSGEEARSVRHGQPVGVSIQLVSPTSGELDAVGVAVKAFHSAFPFN